METIGPAPVPAERGAERAKPPGRHRPGTHRGRGSRTSGVAVATWLCTVASLTDPFAAANPLPSRAPPNLDTGSQEGSCRVFAAAGDAAAAAA
ncbi:unnamed protein product [Lampetra fluviatilis]